MGLCLTMFQIIMIMTLIQRYTQNELTALYNIKKYGGTICRKIQRQFFFLKYYICIQSTTKRKEQRSTDKDKHSEPPTLKKKVKQYCSFSLQTYKPYSSRCPIYTHTKKTNIRLGYFFR